MFIRVLKWTSGVLLALTVFLGVVLAIAPRIDMTSNTGWLEEQLSDAMGREVALNGPVHFVLGRYLQLSANEIAILNPSWAQSDRLLDASEFSFTIDLLPLLVGVLHVSDIRLSDAKVWLEVSPRDGESWSAAEEGQNDEWSDEEAAGLAPRIIVERIRLSKVSVGYHDPAESVSVNLQLDEMTQANQQGILRLDGYGFLNEAALKIEGEVGTLDALLAGRDIALDLQVDLDEMAFSVHGDLGEPQRLEDLELVFAARGPNLAPLLLPFGIDPRQLGDIDLQVAIKDLERGFAWESKGRFGPLNLNSQGSLEEPLEFDDVRLKLAVDGEDLSAIGRVIGISALPRQPYRLHGSLSRNDTKLQKDLVIETGGVRVKLTGDLPRFPRFDDGSSTLELSVPKPARFNDLVGINLEGIGPLEAKMTLASQEDGEEIVEAQLRFGGNRFNALGPIGSYPDYRGTQLEFELVGNDLKMLSLLTGTGKPVHGDYRIAGNLTVPDSGTVALHLSEGSRIGSVNVSADGELGKFADLDAIRLPVKVWGQSLQSLGDLLAQEGWPDKPFELATELAGSLDAPALAGLTVGVGDGRLRLDGRVGLPPEFAGTRADVAVKVPRLATLLPDLVDEAWAQQEYLVTGRLDRTGQKLELRDLEARGKGLSFIGTASLPIETGLSGARIRLTAMVDELDAVLPASRRYQPPRTAMKVDIDVMADSNESIQGQVTAELGDARFKGSGALPLGKQGKEVFSLSLNGSDLSALGAVEGLALPRERYSLTSRLERTEQGYAARDVRVELGNGVLEGEIEFGELKRPFLKLNATAEGFDLDPFLSGDRTRDTDEEPKVDADGSSARQPSERLIPNEAIPTEWLSAVDADIDIAATSLNWPDPVFTEQVLVRDFRLSMQLDNGDLKIAHLRMLGDRGEVGLQGSLKQSGQAITADLQLEADRFRFGILAVGTGLDRLPPHQLSMKLSTHGATFSQLAERLDGEIRLVGAEGETTNAGLDGVMGDFLGQLVSTVDPFTKKEAHTQIECTAAVIGIDGGIVRIDPGFVIRTDKIDIAVKGVIDLGAEKLDINFKNSARKGLGISAAGLVNPYVKVSGTLSKPGITLDAPVALLSGTAAVASGGLSVVVTSLLDRVATLENPCARVAGVEPFELAQ